MSEKDLSPHVYRLFAGAKSGMDWHERGKSGYTRGEIDQIVDPAQGSTKEITSIPSPWARVHLFENAFREVAAKAIQNPDSLADDSNYHMLVSDALDVAQTFFNYDGLRETGKFKLRLIAWNRRERIDALKRSSKARHKLLGETLDLFLKQDKEGSNFDKMDDLYLLYVNDRLIGGTSPSTLFFAAYNEFSDGYGSDRRLGDLGLKEDRDTFFDEKPNPLHARSIDFQRYIFGLFYTYPVLQERMRDLWEYIQVSKKFIQEFDKTRYENIKDIFDKTQYNPEKFNQEFKELHIEGRDSEVVHVFRDEGIHLRVKSTGELRQSIQTRSGFIIHPVKEGGYKPADGERLPMVLQNNFNKSFVYFNNTWDARTKVPYIDETPVEERILPGEAHLRYPYLTVSDFLEPYLLRLPDETPIDEDHFYVPPKSGKFKSTDSSRKIPGEGHFLLPLTDIFFKYFDRSFLEMRTLDGKPYLNIHRDGEKLDDPVKVELRIPVRHPDRSDEIGGIVLLERTYYPGKQPQISRDKNDGALREVQINLGVFPFFFTDPPMTQYISLAIEKPIYTGEDYQSLNYRLEMWQAGGHPERLTEIQETARTDMKEHDTFNLNTKYYRVDKPYSYLRIGNGKQSAVIFPKIRRQSIGNQPVYAAIDLGTTNTHVALSIGKDDQQPAPVTYDIIDKILVTLLPAWIEGGILRREVVQKELIPFAIGTKHKTAFPMRTVLSELQNVPKNERRVMGNINIPFLYERAPSWPHEQITDNLKWRSIGFKDDDLDRRRLEEFITALFILLRIIVIRRGGNPNTAHLVWFYPTSMGSAQIKGYREIWETLAHRYFSASAEILEYIESVAPYYAFDPNQVKSNNHPVINIDIGGGTTDILIVYKGVPVNHSSFRFAGDVLFGNGYGAPYQSNNGFARIFRQVLEQKLAESKDYILRNIWEDIKTKSSININSFFFSLASNRDLLDQNIEISFQKTLEGSEDAKFVFTVFFGAIVYHTAMLMRQLGKQEDDPNKYSMPRNIVLSGKGSNVVGMFGGYKFTNAEKLVKKIYEHVYHPEPYHGEGLKIVANMEPKEATCNGGILLARETARHGKDPALDIKKPVIWMADAKNVISYGDSTNYKTLLDNPGLKKEIVESYTNCIKTLIGILKDPELYQNIGLNPKSFPMYEQALLSDAHNDLEEGFRQRMLGRGLDEFISETPFFYPLIGGMWKLIDEIAQKFEQAKN